MNSRGNLTQNFKQMRPVLDMVQLHPNVLHKITFL